MLAAVLLGGGAAAIVGVVTILAGWARSREALPPLLNNLATYAWFPLLSGLLFHWMIGLTHFRSGDPTYYLVVFGTFVFALLVNVASVAGYLSWQQRTGWLSGMGKILRPILPAELFANLLTLIAVYLAAHMGLPGLLLFAIVLVVFQYLVGELLISQSRGEELRLIATTDELTGLANRKSFGDRLTEEIESCRTGGGAFAVILLDLDRFKEINDTLGHQYGDVLLEQLGPRLASRVGEEGLVARLGGDEFAVLSPWRTDRPHALERLATDLIACVHEPTVIDQITLEVGSSVGIARFPQDGEDAQTLMRRADIALYAAKEHRDAYRFYEPSHDNHSTRRLSLLGDFRRALGSGEIVVHFQPIVDVLAGRVAGAEALVRWEHPTLGMVPPGVFLQSVEQTGLIGPLTRHVLDRSIDQCASWRRNGLDLTVSVNLSVRNLMDAGLPGDLARMLRDHRLAPDALQLEITESMIMSDPTRALATVHRLRRLGVRLAVDDFGTGHSSLANLKRLPIDALKIDRSFVTPMLHDPSDLVIVRSTVGLGHDLGLKIVAEGVEDAETLDSLRELGCDMVQGYHLSRPVAADAFVAWARAFAPETAQAPAAVARLAAAGGA
jgi:diguanylate cyclase (GGDEF)-like protein